MAVNRHCCVQQAMEISRDLDRALAAGDSLEALVALYDRLSGHYNEAKGSVRHALAAATSARPQLMFVSRRCLCPIVGDAHIDTLCCLC